MISTHEIQQHLRHQLSWKPGWTIEVRETRWEGPEIFICGAEPDTDGMGEMIDLGVNSYLPPFDTLGQFEAWLQRRLDRIAIHESHEWFKRNGKTVFDPHGDPDEYKFDKQQDQGVLS